MLSFQDRVWIKVKSAYLRITLSKATFAFFIFSFIHCFAQGILQSVLFTLDSNASRVIHSITLQAEVDKTTQFPLLNRPDHNTFQLQLCKDIPFGSNGTNPCNTLFETVVDTSKREAPPISYGFDLAYDDLVIRTVNTGSLPHNISVIVDDKTEVPLSSQCVTTLLYPDMVMNNMRRESLMLIAIQFWLFAISFIALMFDSIPHTISVLCVRLPLTTFSAYSIWRSGDIQLRFAAILASEGTPCSMDMFPKYFSTRLALEIPDFVLNLTALIISAFISTKLLRTYAAQTFKRVGPPPHIVRIYRFFLATLVNLHLAVFFVIGALALWIDELLNSPLVNMTEIKPLFLALLITTTILLFPLLALGWLALRRERKGLMTVYLAIAFAIVIGWGIQFYSRIYRWTFVQWPFMGCVTTAALMLLVGSIFFGCISWTFFNQGLSQYLHVEDSLSSTDFEHDSFETSITVGLPGLGKHDGQDLEAGRDVKDFDFVDLKEPETIYRSTSTRM